MQKSSGWPSILVSYAFLIPCLCSLWVLTRLGCAESSQCPRGGEIQRARAVPQRTNPCPVSSQAQANGKPDCKAATVKSQDIRYAVSLL